jgi:hypothetical protein
MPPASQEQARQPRLGTWQSAFAMLWHWLCIVPTDPDYHASSAKQLFCSDEEARAASWDRPPAL